MLNIEVGVYLTSVLVLAKLHTLGVALYKNATISFVRLRESQVVNSLSEH